MFFTYVIILKKLIKINQFVKKSFTCKSEDKISIFFLSFSAEENEFLLDIKKPSKIRSFLPFFPNIVENHLSQ